MADIVPVPKSELDKIRTENTGIRKSRRKKPEIQLGGDSNLIETVQVVEKLSPAQTIDFLKTAIAKEVGQRTNEERQAIAAQSSFVVALLQSSVEENRKLDDAHNTRMTEIEVMNQKALNEVSELFQGAWESHNDMVVQLNTMPPDAAQLLVEAFGSNDPKD